MQCLEITPYLLHKEIYEDVLINSVQMLPFSFIASSDWNELKGKCSSDEFKVFTKNYERFGNHYVLKGLPPVISPEDSQAYDNFEIDLSSFYALKENGDLIIKEQLMPASVITMLRSNGEYSSADEKILESDDTILIQTLLSTHLTPPKAPAFSYVARNDTSNYYFYRKPHEHMPGTMLIEMARQALYHYAYSETGHQRGDVAISMTDLDIEFSSYVESAYSIEILAYQSDILLRPQPRTVDKTAAFYQNGRKVAQVRIKGSVMKSRLFKRLRTLHIPTSHWFSLSPRVSHHILLGNDHGEYKQASLHQISMSGIQLIEDIDDFDYSVAMLYLEGMGFIKLDLSGEKDSYHGYLELPFRQLTPQQSYQLQEIIKCNGIFHDKHLSSNQEYMSNANRENA